MEHTVFVEGKLRGVEDFDALTEALTDALVDMGASDPFVFTDAGAPSFRVEITVDAGSDVESLGVGVPLIARVLDAAGVAVEEPSARTGVPVPA